MPDKIVIHLFLLLMKLCKIFFTALLMILYVTVSYAQFTYNELTVDYDSAWVFKNLSVIPIHFKSTEKENSFMPSQKTPPITFAEAMALHKVRVQEMQYEMGADVNWLQITNHSKQYIMIQSGEIVEGGKQDRMIGETKFIAPGTIEYVNVYCVEKRRWDEKPKTFSYQGVANSEVRKAMDVSGRQADVWKEIDRQFESLKKKSETFAYLDLYKDAITTDTAYTRFFQQKIDECDRNLAGFIFISGDRILGVEIFSSNDLTRMSYSNMLASYIQTVLVNGAKPKVSVDTVKSFMNKILMSEESQKAFVSAHGKIHKSDNKIIHLLAYP